MAPAESSGVDDSGDDERDVQMDDVPMEVSIDEGALYSVVRRAVEDAVLGVIGTLLLVGVALVLVWVGGAMAFGAGGRQPVAAVAGLGIALVGVYIAAASLEVIPPIRKWF